MKTQIAILGVLGATLLAGVMASDARPELDHPWTDGLYSTITGPFSTGGVKPKNAVWLNLKVEGMNESIWTRAVIQKDKAPVVVILNGTFGRCFDPETNLWMAWLEEEGFHVFTFDSTFHQAMTKASRHGVAGYLEGEAELAGRIIKAFLDCAEMAGKAERVGVVGMSYGGTQALLLARMNRQGRLPFKLDAVRAYSAPVSFEAATKRLDEFFTCAWTLADHFWTFSNLKREYPVRENYDPKMMAAALARMFRLGLTDVIEANDDLYGKKLDQLKVKRIGLPEKDMLTSRDERVAYAEGFNFQAYIDRVVVPYWKALGKIGGREDLFRAGELAELLKDAGPSVQAILVANDPLNEDGAAEKLAQAGFGESLLVLPRGGHLGFVNSPLVRQQFKGLFHTTLAMTESEKALSLSLAKRR